MNCPHALKRNLHFNHRIITHLSSYCRLSRVSSTMQKKYFIPCHTFRFLFHKHSTDWETLLSFTHCELKSTDFFNGITTIKPSRIKKEFKSSWKIEWERKRVGEARNEFRFGVLSSDTTEAKKKENPNHWSAGNSVRNHLSTDNVVAWIWISGDCEFEMHYWNYT